MSNLKVGDLVQFKSGGPPMTALDVKATVKCGWFTEGRYYDACFPDDCLVRYEPVKINVTYTPYVPPVTITPLCDYHFSSDIKGAPDAENT